MEPDWLLPESLGPATLGRGMCSPHQSGGAKPQPLASQPRETITFAGLRRKAIAKYRMPAPVAIGYKQDFELTALREGGTHGRSHGQARGYRRG